MEKIYHKKGALSTDNPGGGMWLYQQENSGKKGGENTENAAKWFTIIIKEASLVECYIICCVMSTNVTNSTSGSVFVLSKTTYLEMGLT